MHEAMVRTVDAAVAKKRPVRPADAPEPSSPLVLPGITTPLAADSPIVQFYSDSLKKSREEDGFTSSRMPPLTTRPENRTGIPDGMKARFESFSGLSFDDVRVHYNSAEPARLDALAYTQGNEVHIGPGQERHLKHELGHVVQQKRSLVRPEARLWRSPAKVNLDPALEGQADRLSSRAIRTDVAERPGRLSNPRGFREDVIQEISINSVNYTPYAKKTKALFTSDILPALLESGYTKRGLSARFLEFVRMDSQYATVAECHDAFEEYLHSLGILRRDEFDITKMPRPAWPDKLSDELSGKARVLGKTRDIRHVIRNATLVRTLAKYEQMKGPEGIVFLARSFGINEPYPQAALSLYKLLYLNKNNLWYGDSVMNRVIGLLADAVRQYGAKLAAGEIAFDPEKFFTMLQVKSSLVTGADAVKNTILETLHELVIQCQENFPAEQVGPLIEDIGLNLGFDFVDDNSDDIADRQAVLLDVETALQGFLRTGTADVRRILMRFYNIPDSDEVRSQLEYAEYKMERQKTVTLENDGVIMNSELLHEEPNSELLFLQPDLRIEFIIQLLTRLLGDENVDSEEIRANAEGMLAEFFDTDVEDFLGGGADAVLERMAKFYGIDENDTDQLNDLRGELDDIASALLPADDDGELPEWIYAVNNCLIHAIMDAYGIPRDLQREIAIRRGLEGMGIDYLDELEATDQDTVLYIFEMLGIDPGQHPLVVYGLDTRRENGFVPRAFYGCNDDIPEARHIYIHNRHFQAERPTLPTDDTESNNATGALVVDNEIPL